MGKYSIQATVYYADTDQQQHKAYKKQENVPVEFFTVGQGKLASSSDEAKSYADLETLFNKAAGARVLDLFVKKGIERLYFKPSTYGVTLYMKDGTGSVVMTSECQEKLKIFRTDEGQLSRLKLAFQDSDSCFAPQKA